MITISNNTAMPPKFFRSVTNPPSLTALNKEPLVVTSSMSALTSPASTAVETDLSLSTSTDLDPSSTGAFNSATASFAEHRARREWKARQHLRRFRQRYLETIEEDCFSDFSDDDNKENVMSRDINSNVVKTSRKKKRKTPKKHYSSNQKVCNDVMPQEKLYFSNSSGDSSSLSTKKSSGRLYFPSPDDTAIGQSETSRKQVASESRHDNVVNSIKPCGDDLVKIEGSPIIMWSNDKTFLCDHTALTSAWHKTNQTTTTTNIESKSIEVNTSMTLAKSEDEVISPEQPEVTLPQQTEVTPSNQNDKVNEDTGTNVVEQIEKSEIANNESRRMTSLTDEADQRTALKNISRISGSSRTSLREQTSAGNLVSGAFHSTFSYPLHSTLQQTEQSVLALSPIASPRSPMYNNRHPQQIDLKHINSKSTKHHTTNKYVRRDIERNSSDNERSCRAVNSAKKIGRASGLGHVNKNYGGWTSSEKFQSISEMTSQNYHSARTSRKLVDPVNDNPVQYKNWMPTARSNDCLATPVNTLERRTPLKRSVGCTRIGLHTLQAYPHTALGDPHASFEATRGSPAELNSLSTDRSSTYGSSFSTVHHSRDSSTETFDQSKSYASVESHLRRRQTHQYLYENSQSSLEQDDVINDTRVHCRRQCTHHVHKHRECCTRRIPSTPRHIHPLCQRHNTLPDLIRLPSHEVYHHECVQQRLNVPSSEQPLDQPYHQRYDRARLEHVVGDELSTRVGPARKSEKQSKLGGRKLGCFTRMLCTNSEVTQIFTSDQFE